MIPQPYPRIRFWYPRIRAYPRIPKLTYPDIFSGYRLHHTTRILKFSSRIPLRIRCRVWWWFFWSPWLYSRIRGTTFSYPRTRPQHPYPRIPKHVRRDHSILYNFSFFIKASKEFPRVPGRVKSSQVVGLRTRVASIECSNPTVTIFFIPVEEFLWVFRSSHYFCFTFDFFALEQIWSFMDHPQGALSQTENSFLLFHI